MFMAWDSGIEADALQPMELGKIQRAPDRALEELPRAQLLKSAGADLLVDRCEDARARTFRRPGLRTARAGRAAPMACVRKRRSCFPGEYPYAALAIEYVR